ncbi:caspase domain-containing protein [Pseudorhodobacter sp. W20_MBD10_FR17]|uniref:caspase family protein n=1 Tax=Pseudorhodobacter sp. W20_MBD10_FR17 TaxID=3240266 RepID=UPI003F98145C
MRHFIQPLLLTLGLLANSPARAEIRALLVGVSDYEFLDADLKGPEFDVALMAQTLAARGVSPDHITSLSSAKDATGLPRKAEILAAMDRLAATAGPEDTVVFYFSGHGSQAPDTSGDEQGGADEILLPMDAKGWKGAIAQVENALLDDELAAWAKRITATGAKLVGIIDACHSGTSFRAVSGIGIARVLPPELLGIPDDMPSQPLTQSDDMSGDFAFLYSSQPDQRSFEYPLGTGADQRWHGAFTLALTQTLGDAPQASWRQVLVATRDRMTQGSARQEPDGEGPMLDAPVFGTGPTTLRFAVQGDQLQAGLLQGLTEGSTVTLYAQPGAGDALAEARLTSLTAQTAALDFGTTLPPNGAAWAELTLPAPPAPLRLAPAVRAEAGDYTAQETAIAMLVTEGTVTIDAQSPDLVPILTGGTLALANPDGVLDPLGHNSTPRAAPRAGEDATAAPLRLLENAAHATRMRAVLAGLSAGRGLSLGGQAITMTMERKPGALAGNASSGNECARSGSAAPFSPQSGVSACDELWLTLANTSGRVQDVTVLYLAADFTLTPLWPVHGLSNRLALGEAARVGLRITNDDPTAFATEELLVIALSPEVDEPRADLSSLATPDTLRDTGGAGSALASIAQLMAPTDTTQTRGFSLKRPSLTLLRQPIFLKPHLR